MSWIKTIFQKIILHKKISILILIVLCGVGYFVYRQKAQDASQKTRYVLGVAEKGTLIASLSATGQVVAVSKIDIKPQASGVVTQIKIKQGQEVKSGEVLMMLDQRNAVVALTLARASFSSAQANYQKLVDGLRPDELTSFYNQKSSAELAYQQAQSDAVATIRNAELALIDAQNNLKLTSGGEQSQVINQAYENAVTSLSSMVSKIDDSLTQADNVLGIDNTFAGLDIKNYLSILNPNYLTSAKQAYAQAKSDWSPLRPSITSLTAESDHQVVDTVLKNMQVVVGDLTKLFIHISDALTATPPVGTLTQSALDGKKSNIESARSAVASLLSTITNQKQLLTNARASLVGYQIQFEKAQQNYQQAKNFAESSVQDKKFALSNASSTLSLKISPPLSADVLSAKAQVASALAQVQNAQTELQNTTIRAFFDGQIASVVAQKGDQVGSGSAVATLVTKQEIAQVSLNEVDVAKIKIGQKVTLTFDAIEDLSITGKVSQIDTLGTVTQGVVNYNVQIAFDTQDDRVKPGMSVSAAVIFDSKSDVVLVPNNAIKTFGSQAYIEVVHDEKINATNISENPITLSVAPEQKIVQTGLSNDSVTEIVGGVNEGDVVVTQTIAASTAAKTSATNASAFRLPVGGAGGGTIRNR